MNWKKIVDNHSQDIVNSKINDIYKVLKDSQDYNPFGLLGGYSGIILFLYYYYKYTNKKEHLLLLHEKIEFVYSAFVNIPYSSFSNGLSGVCWLLRFLHKKKIIENADVDDTLFEVDNLIYQNMLREISNKNYDFLHGSLGMAYYFATSNSSVWNDAIDVFLEAIDNDKISNLDGSVKWLSEVYVNYEKVSSVYNLSLSHGMAGIIAFLTKVIKNHNNKQAIDLLKKTTLFYRNNINPSKYKSTFSKWFEPDNNNFLESHLSWCYGDPGIAQALYNAGMILNDQELVNMALVALIKATYRVNVSVEHIQEACFCHGSSSLCHIFNRLYQLTNMQEFKNTALYWLNDTLMKSDNLKSELAGYSFYEEEEKVNTTSLLSGLTGIGLSLLSAIDSIEPQWDESVLLS